MKTPVNHKLTFTFVKPDPQTTINNVLRVTVPTVVKELILSKHGIDIVETTPGGNLEKDLMDWHEGKITINGLTLNGSTSKIGVVLPGSLINGKIKAESLEKFLSSALYEDFKYFFLKSVPPIQTWRDNENKKDIHSFCNQHKLKMTQETIRMLSSIRLTTIIK
jgi:hypothetical protein